jgi:hypothetical protein
MERERSEERREKKGIDYWMFVSATGSKRVKY